MFNNFFVRSTIPILLREYAFYTRLHINPEIYIDGDTLSALKPGTIDQLTSILTKFNAHTIHAPFLDLSPGGFDHDILKISRDKLNKILDLAHLWHSSLMVAHFNYLPHYYQESLDGWLKNAADTFRGLAMRSSGPLIALENIIESTPSIANRLIQRINHGKVVHCFDFGHHHVFSSISSKEWLSSIQPGSHIHFHFHDNMGRHDDHLPLGKGNIDWQRVKKEITALGKSFSVGLEPHNREDLIQTVEYYTEHFL